MTTHSEISLKDTVLEQRLAELEASRSWSPRVVSKLGTQDLAGANEIMLTDDVYEAPGVRDALVNYDVAEESGVMRGVEEEFTVHRAGRTG